MRGLVVEDDRDVRAVLEETMVTVGCDHVDTAVSAEAALGVALKRNYDLVILDLRLPDLSGLDILPSLRSYSPQAVIAIVSGYADMVRAQDMEYADVVITKPFGVDRTRQLVSLARDLAEKLASIRAMGDRNRAGE